MTNQEENTNKKFHVLDQRSGQVREILGKTPNWMIRFGISLIFGILLLLILGSSIIRYNDIISTRIVITSKNPPIYIKARSSGRLTEIFVKPDQKVDKDEILAVVENTAQFDDVKYLKRNVANFEKQLISLDSMNVSFPSQLNLGELQVSYGNFLSRYQSFILYDNLEPNAKEAKLIKKQLFEQNKFLRLQQRQLKIIKKDLELSKNNFERNKILFQKSVISKAEYELASREYLTDQQQFEGFLTNISNTQIAIANFNNLLSKTNIAGTEFQNAYRQELERAYQDLITSLNTWEQKYLIQSPIEGTVTLFDIWNQYQNVTIGETLFTVVPINIEDLIGRVTLPIRNSGKVKEGQRAIIKIDNYPFEEWGSLNGKITNISEVPKQGEEAFYTVYIAIDSLTTSYDKSLKFKQEMQGSAEIIIEELSILERVFYKIRKIFSR